MEKTKRDSRHIDPLKDEEEILPVVKIQERSDEQGASLER